MSSVPSFLPFLFLFLISLCPDALAQRLIKPDSHLTNFHSRPEIKAPLWNIKTNNLKQRAPGYWFVAPYHDLSAADSSGQKWDSCQIGPHIYDNDGELVWSGACRYDNRNAFDFKANLIDGEYYLSLLVRTGPKDHKVASGVILNNTYGEEADIVVHDNANRFNVHEFNIVDNGTRVVAMYSQPESTTRKMRKQFSLPKPSFVNVNGFREFKILDGKKVFDWNSLNYIPLNETAFPPPSKLVIHRPGWDYIHLNSVDKFPNGDYLVSSRYMNTIYRFDGTSGKVVWRFGGEQSDFVLDGFNFSRQHDARIRDSNSTHILMSFLDNASSAATYDLWNATSSYSRGMFVWLDTSSKPMRATLWRHYDRPDGELSHERGNVQLLDNGNVFICWSGGGYFSEHTQDGKVVQEASFATGNRYNSYRGYKFAWMGRPSGAPAVKAFAYGTTHDSITTVIYVSWNGDTEVAKWRFYEKSKKGPGEEVFMGESVRKGFETMYMHSGYAGWVVAEAVDRFGHTLRKTMASKTAAPDDWQAAGYSGNERPKPEKPSDAKGSENQDDQQQDKPVHDNFDGFPGYQQDDSQDDPPEGPPTVDLTNLTSSNLSPFIAIILLGLVGMAVYFAIRFTRRRPPQKVGEDEEYFLSDGEGDDDDEEQGDRDYRDKDEDNDNEQNNSINLQDLPPQRSTARRRTLDSSEKHNRPSDPLMGDGDWGSQDW